LKEKAKKLGLWNMFLPKGHYKESPGFTNLEYGLIAEWLGKSRVASEATNCAAPDTGNMEVLAKYGNEAQKEQWLKPLMAGQIRSAFLMTEPDVASSDATNIALSIKKEGNEYVLNGSVSFVKCTSICCCDINRVRNGGPAELVTHDARSIL
jgi:acyl-CoA dehydrogenase